MIQALPFNQANGGTTPNFCLLNVCKGYGIGNKFDSAWTAWNNTQQHFDEPPTGLDVPVFFSYIATIDGVNKNWGHIGVRLANGQFWSDGKLYPTIAAYTANHTPKYVGWGESINNVAVLKQGDLDMIPDQYHLTILFQQILGRNPEVSEINEYVGKMTYTQLLDILVAQPAYKEVADTYQLGYIAKRDNWDLQLKSLQSQIDDLTHKLNVVQASNGDATKWQTLKTLIKELIS